MSNYPDGMTAHDIPGWDGKGECDGCEEEALLDDLADCCGKQLCKGCLEEHYDTIHAPAEDDLESW